MCAPPPAASVSKAKRRTCSKRPPMGIADGSAAGSSAASVRSLATMRASSDRCDPLAAAPVPNLASAARAAAAAAGRRAATEETADPAKSINCDGADIADSSSCMSDAWDTSAGGVAHAVATPRRSTSSRVRNALQTCASPSGVGAEAPMINWSRAVWSLGNRAEKMVPSQGEPETAFGEATIDGLAHRRSKNKADREASSPPTARAIDASASELTNPFTSEAP
mmetsp:Transcript_21396/g.65096  ORF Transcript_21396/g.65096 Transcript_21396/m.65096 type:complete len:224 (+) Transcript_21396:2316-2987(+)|eukprot:scaffold229290_cov28-Tisochrysis_lutea.AAC.5